MNKQELLFETELAFQKYKELQEILNGKNIGYINDVAQQYAKKRAISILIDLNSYLRKLEDYLDDICMESVPVADLGPHADFLSKELLPIKELIRMNLWKLLTFPVLEMDIASENVKTSSNIYKRALEHLIEFWVETLSDVEKEEYAEFLDTCRELEDVVGSNWFDIDTWKERQKKLRPIILNKDGENKLRDHIRIRLMEIYRSYVFGNFFSVVALSRSLVEFVLRLNARKVGILIEYENIWGEKFSSIARNLEKINPALASHVEAVRDLGNIVMHPKKRNVVAVPRVLESEALECINNVVTITEEIYCG